MISIISPIYNSELCIKKLVEKIFYYTKKITNEFELILVDDGSNDNSWNKIQQLKKKYKFIKGIKLKQNYGQHSAIYTGIKYSTKNLLIIMDCDLQDNPKHIIEMYRAYIKYKSPIIIQHSYEDFKIRSRIVSNLFWFFLSIISFKNFSPNLGNYMLIDKKIRRKYLTIKSIGYLYGDLIMQKNNFFLLKKKRSKGIRKKTTYSLAKLINLAAILIYKYNFLGQIFQSGYNKKIPKIIVQKILK